MPTRAPARAAGRVPARPPRVVLLLHPGALGDLIQALPAFGAVRAGLPDARLVLVTDAALATFARDTALVDGVVGFDAAVAYHGAPAARLRLLAGLVRRMRAERPDAVALFKGAPVYAALAAASGAPVRAGLVRGRAAALLTHPVPIDPERHREDRFLDVAAALGLDPARRRPACWPARPLPAALRTPGRWIAVAPGGARNAKEQMASRRWPADRFAAVAAAMVREHPDARIVLLGGAGDRAEVDVVRAALPAGRVVDLAGATDLATTRAVIAAAAVYVGNDSGLMHLAGTTGTPAVIPFGPTDPRVAAPRSAGTRALWSPARLPACVDEATGRHRACAVPCCIARVDVDAVRAAVAEALADAALAGAGPSRRGAG